jgi:methionyl-tRNA formyltransferase
MRIIFFGTPDFAVPSLQRLLTRPEFEVVAVVTQPDRRRGRGSAMIASAVKQVAIEAGVPVWQPTRVKKDEDTLTRLRDAQADAFVVVAYGQLLSAEILQMPRLGCVNAHGSLLPAYRGAAPIQRSLADGVTETGIDTMLMDVGMDTGPLLLRAKTDVPLLDNADSLAHRLALLAADLLPETLLGLDEGDLEPQPQDHDRATAAPPLRKEEFVLRWDQPTLTLHNAIRGFFPHCVAQFRGASLKVLATAPLGPDYWDGLPFEFSVLEHDWPALERQFESVPHRDRPGTVVAVVKNIGPIVRTQDGYLLLRKVIPAGKRLQSGWDFANGLHLEPGEMLEELVGDRVAEMV